MDSFQCRACGDKSPVRIVKAASKETFLVCVHCSAEHVLRFPAADSGALPEVEIAGLQRVTVSRACVALTYSSQFADWRDRFTIRPTSEFGPEADVNSQDSPTARLGRMGQSA